MASIRELRPFGFESFSLWCAKRLLERHPEWLPFVRADVEEQDGLRVHTLVIDLPSENPRVSEPLSLSVDVDRIVAVSWFSTGGTSRWHRDWVFYMPHHPRPPHWTDEGSGLDEIAEFVERFMNEEIVALCTKDSGGGGTFWSLSAQDAREGRFRRGEMQTLIRSWRGTLNLSS